MVRFCAGGRAFGPGPFLWVAGSECGGCWLSILWSWPHLAQHVELWSWPQLGREGAGPSARPLFFGLLAQYVEDVSFGCSLSSEERGPGRRPGPLFFGLLAQCVEVPGSAVSGRGLSLEERGPGRRPGPLFFSLAPQLLATGRGLSVVVASVRKRRGRAFGPAPFCLGCWLSAWRSVPQRERLLVVPSVQKERGPGLRPGPFFFGLLAQCVEVAGSAFSGCGLSSEREGLSVKRCDLSSEEKGPGLRPGPLFFGLLAQYVEVAGSWPQFRRQGAGLFSLGCWLSAARMFSQMVFQRHNLKKRGRAEGPAPFILKRLLHIQVLLTPHAK